MSLSAVRPYFRGILNTLGFEEWETSFNSDNIPKTIAEKVYHLTVEPISVGVANQLAREFTFPITLKMYLRDHDLNTDAIDDAILQTEIVIGEVLKPSNRLTQPGIKDVVLTSISYDPMNNADEKSVMISMSFNTKIFCAIT